MSVFTWFFRKLRPQPSSGTPGAESHTAAQSSRREQGQGVRRSERSERREQLYGVVRDVMVRAGVLSASYKFKVLSLDHGGQRFVVMMDLARTHAGETARLGEIESMLAHTAKARMDAVVSAVYWRISDQIGVAPVQPQHHMPAMAPSPRQRSGYEPIDEQEMAAFKQAVALQQGGAARSASASASATVRRSGPLLGPGAADRHSEFPQSDMGPLDLGVSQYGELR